MLEGKPSPTGWRTLAQGLATVACIALLLGAGLVVSGSLQAREGCQPDTACVGPEGTYYTLFGTEVAYTLGHGLASLALGGLAGGLLTVGVRRGWWGIPPSVRVALASALIPVAYVVLVYLFPVHMIY